MTFLFEFAMQTKIMYVHYDYIYNSSDSKHNYMYVQYIIICMYVLYKYIYINQSLFISIIINRSCRQIFFLSSTSTHWRKRFSYDNRVDTFLKCLKGRTRKQQGTIDETERKWRIKESVE